MSSLRYLHISMALWALLLIVPLPTVLGQSNSTSSGSSLSALLPLLLLMMSQQGQVPLPTGGGGGFIPVGGGGRAGSSSEEGRRGGGGGGFVPIPSAGLPPGGGFGGGGFGGGSGLGFGLGALLGRRKRQLEEQLGQLTQRLPTAAAAGSLLAPAAPVSGGSGGGPAAAGDNAGELLPDFLAVPRLSLERMRSLQLSAAPDNWRDLAALLQNDEDFRRLLRAATNATDKVPDSAETSTAAEHTTAAAGGHDSVNGTMASSCLPSDNTCSP
ncbi:translation initiation factor IF-2-like [Paramacrobiotus metropolitanus]|uniref:translation initiation factor IF-2-like n=1 Tax=Paramacrobiotus metropolitanus TaxID=2943436 RepID=UPI00244581CA|nr:translation initiation factor IF-2-like [Paramacrobiotus metropolitanus]